MLGWNVVYGFNDSDFEVSEHLLSIYLDEYQDAPWDALKYLVGVEGTGRGRGRGSCISVCLKGGREIVYIKEW